MPLRYQSETAEHLAVRRAAGLFDLSHMGEITVSGPGAAAALDHALVGQLSALAPGRARYTMMCAEDGGVVDDLVVYRTGDEFLVVANAANTAVVDAELRRRSAGFEARITDRTGDYALIAIQGPEAAAILGPLTDADPRELKYYTGRDAIVAGHPAWLARTGYTGEDGFEIFSGRSRRSDLEGADQRPDSGRPGAGGLGRARYAPARGWHAALRQRAGPGRDALRRWTGASGQVGKTGRLRGRFGAR